ncbi:L,D-transpeptidase [Aureimonas jatrophae]|jgi:lipoprotein-anchoring transpeptidase ErfK/SrfK|uniref:Lipoprotein-anchoring transpeptidase ErfK/SrfK n=1 Tax=Aureimonas jatrophae TaxID=1166073 RepID=A0A1H0DL87_9HYPH|nr:L,D-transpeptidase [Aureimonas jatrophae]MBB3951953.1 lipoprotein-anchoring transpeptidase ErfK/SrfK [Aureimonas jatrophae]SDN70853.1 Lipoprotein-anchoring transpeptidase ErfK/SrfK [Aureimonas jatrophae]
MKSPLFAALLAAATLAGAAAAEAQQVRYYDYSTGQWVRSGDRAAIRSGGPAQPQVRRGETRQPNAMRKVDPRFMRQPVRISTKEKAGTIIIDTDRKFLYLVEGGGTAIRYGVGVGKEGFAWGGTMNIQRKAEWPGWTPPAEMVRRERAKGRILPAYMAGGPENPLGARAMYLYRNGRDSMFRIHGTNQPWTIGLNMSSGCIRMMNEDVTDLYERVGKGTKVVVLAPGASGSQKVYAETGSIRQAKAGGRPLLASIFGG